MFGKKVDENRLEMVLCLIDSVNSKEALEELIKRAEIRKLIIEKRGIDEQSASS